MSIPELLKDIPRGISIKQPWAWLIAAGWKPVENRNQCFKYRGPVALHASKTVDENLFDPVNLYRAALNEKHGSLIAATDLWRVKGYFESWHDDYPENRGAIIGVATIVGCKHESDSRWFTGPHGLVMNNPVLFDTPIPWRGALGIWELKDSQAI